MQFFQGDWINGWYQEWPNEQEEISGANEKKGNEMGMNDKREQKRDESDDEMV